MDVSKTVKASRKKSSTAETTRPPLASADNKNGTTRRSQTREVTSRYRSPTTSAPKRCPSPNTTSSTSTMSVPKRAISTEGKRPSTVSSPSTPVQDTNAVVLLTPRKTLSKTESLWPSTMRSLSVSFQCDASCMSSDRTLRPSSNVAHKGVTPPSGKSTPERRRCHFKGKNSGDHLENSKPVDSLQACLVDQHRWPVRTSGKTSTSLNSKPLQKSSSDIQMQISRLEREKVTLYGNSVDDGSIRVQRPCSSSSSDRASLVDTESRAQSLSTPGSHTSSPSVLRGVSPTRAKANTPSSRGTSPGRVRPSRQPQNPTSVLSFLADIKKGTKAANNMEDVHQLRLLYNRHLQWRYANVQTVAALLSWKAKAEKMLSNICRIIFDLLDSVWEKRSNLQQLRLMSKLYSVLANQMVFLDDWTSVERDHTNSLNWAIQDLQGSTLRIPLTQGATGDIKSVKAAVFSAVDVIKATGSSFCSILSKMEGMKCLVLQLDDVAARERAMLNECESLIVSTAALQVEEYSFRTHLLQMKQGRSNGAMTIVGC